jgi:hypothetical protein
VLIPYTARLNNASAAMLTAIRPSGCFSQSKSLLIMDAPKINFTALCISEFSNTKRQAKNKVGVYKLCSTLNTTPPNDESAGGEG